jgi:hypothetical protein
MKPFKLRPTEPTEYQLHTAVADYLGWALTPASFFTTFPSGWGIMARATAGRLKRAGLKAGVPDILVIHAGQAIFIELKSSTGTTTPTQKEIHMRLLDAKALVFVCNSLDMVIAVLEGAGVPLRRTKGATDVRNSQERSRRAG